MAAIDISSSPRLCLLPQISRRSHGFRSKPRIGFNGLSPALLRRSLAVSCRSKSSGEADKARAEDFVARVLKENPSQVEPRHLVGDKLYTLKERENLGKSSGNAGLNHLLKRLASVLKSESLIGESRDDGEAKEEVYLKDILREYKGKLYVPEQVFGARLSEEEEFKKSFEALPKMSFEDFEKAMKSDKVKLLTWTLSGSEYRDFIVELSEIPGEKSLQRRKW